MEKELKTLSGNFFSINNKTTLKLESQLPKLDKQIIFIKKTNKIIYDL